MWIVGLDWFTLPVQYLPVMVDKWQDRQGWTLFRLTCQTAGELGILPALPMVNFMMYLPWLMFYLGGPVGQPALVGYSESWKGDNHNDDEDNSGNDDYAESNVVDYLSLE